MQRASWQRSCGPTSGKKHTLQGSPRTKITVSGQQEVQHARKHQTINQASHGALTLWLWNCRRKTFKSVLRHHNMVLRPLHHARPSNSPQPHRKNLPSSHRTYPDQQAVVTPRLCQAAAREVMSYYHSETAMSSNTETTTNHHHVEALTSPTTDEHHHHSLPRLQSHTQTTREETEPQQEAETSRCPNLYISGSQTDTVMHHTYHTQTQMDHLQRLISYENRSTT